MISGDAARIDKVYYVMPLVEQGFIKLSIPDKPRSPKQLYYNEG